MKRILPVEELARDARFQHMRIEEAVFDPRNANSEAAPQSTAWRPTTRTPPTTPAR